MYSTGHMNIAYRRRLQFSLNLQYNRKLFYFQNNIYFSQFSLHCPPIFGLAVNEAIFSRQCTKCAKNRVFQFNHSIGSTQPR